MNDKICHVKMLSGEICGRKTYKANEKCIFHLENKSETEDARIFEIVFEKELRRMEDDDNIKSIDFTGFIFPIAINFHKHLFEKHLIFTQVIFNGKANFEGAIFNGEANFEDALFNSYAVFSEAIFNNNTTFAGAIFHEVVMFSKAKFELPSIFIGTKFNHQAFFPDVQFNSYVLFTGATFNKTASFSSTQFKEVNFSSDFLSDVFFIDTKFPINNELIVDFGISKFYKPKEVRFHNTDLSNVSFLHSDIIEIEFLDVRWVKKWDRHIVIDETRIGIDGTTYGAVAQLYRRLRRNYETSYKFSEAGEFFIGEMEMSRLDVNTKIKNKNIREIFLWFKRNFFLLGIYKHISLYGESYIRPAVLALFVIVCYPIMISLFFHWKFGYPFINSLEDYIFIYLKNSIATFFQVDRTYLGERLIGIPILGLFFIALKRKFERKK